MLSLAVKRHFLSPRLVIRPVRNAMRPVLGRQGAYVRGIAKRSIRRSKNRDLSAPPGMPPYTHTGALKRAILYGVGRESVIIGPTASAVGLIGHTHEFGGMEAAVPARRRAANWKLQIGGHGPIGVDARGQPVVVRLRTGRQVRRARQVVLSLPPSVVPGKPRRRYPPRPFMGPALAKARPRLSEFWRKSIRKTA